MSSVAEKIKAVIAEQLGNKNTEITDDSRIMDDLGADSLDIVELFAILEEEFDIKISEKDAEPLVTVGLAIRYIENRLAT